MNPEFKFDHRPHIRSAWNPVLLMRGKFLTDKQIEKYQGMGYYDSRRQFLKELRELRAAKQVAREKREGNFILRDGRMIYDPKF